MQLAAGSSVPVLTPVSLPRGAGLHLFDICKHLKWIEKFVNGVHFSVFYKNRETHAIPICCRAWTFRCDGELDHHPVFFRSDGDNVEGKALKGRSPLCQYREGVGFVVGAA